MTMMKQTFTITESNVETTGERPEFFVVRPQSTNSTSARKGRRKGELGKYNITKVNSSSQSTSQDRNSSQRVLALLHWTERAGIQTMLASESSLRKIWDTPEEDEAWSDL